MTGSVGTIGIAFPPSGQSTRELRVVVPAGTPKAAVLIVHGMAEHYARYQRLADDLSKHGFLVAGFDLIGHGPGTPESELGYFGEHDGWQALVRDVHTAHSLLRQRWPGIDVVLLGHSMGSFLAREYAIQHGKGLKGLVLTGSSWQPKPLCLLGLTISAAQSMLGWYRKPAGLLNQLSFASNNRAFRPNRTPYDWLTRDTEEVDAYVADPYCGFPLKVGGYRELFRGLLLLTRLERLEKVPKHLPVLLMSGSADPLAGKDGSVIHELARQYRQAGLSDITVRLFEHARHELFNELNREEVIDTLLVWLNR